MIQGLWQEAEGFDMAGNDSDIHRSGMYQSLPPDLLELKRSIREQTSVPKGLDAQKTPNYVQWWTEGLLRGMWI